MNRRFKLCASVMLGAMSYMVVAGHSSGLPIEESRTQLPCEFRNEGALNTMCAVGGDIERFANGMSPNSALVRPLLTWHERHKTKAGREELLSVIEYCVIDTRSIDFKCGDRIRTMWHVDDYEVETNKLQNSKQHTFDVSALQSNDVKICVWDREAVYGITEHSNGKKTLTLIDVYSVSPRLLWDSDPKRPENTPFDESAFVKFYREGCRKESSVQR